MSFLSSSSSMGLIRRSPPGLITSILSFQCSRRCRPTQLNFKPGASSPPSLLHLLNSSQHPLCADYLAEVHE